ncbi:mini-chromosome maintenance replisome factor-domain-containing protein [Pisolithus thermaeus]|nr:mini-chromosome maintenance replisome factor-domain-containing protein [Pisolithus thermaeus]
MVSAPATEELYDATGVIQRLYEHYDGRDVGFAAVVASHFSAILFNADDRVRELPSLDVHHPPEAYTNGTLVRFRAMIQDTSLSPELYVAELSNHRCGGWGLSASDSSEASDSVGYQDLQELTAMWAVSVPAESAWHVEEASPLVSSFPAHVPLRPHKFPIPDASHIGVQIKMYDNQSAQLLKPTDIVTFVGILSSEPVCAEFSSPSEVPVLHVICHQTITESPQNIKEPRSVRRELICWISEHVLGGDDLAVEWLLLQLSSKVHTRSMAFLPPSLTLSRFPPPPHPNMLPTLSYALSELLQKYMPVSLSLELLNTKSFTPESREEDLHSGYLQLPAGTTILLTESALREGNVTEKGLMNIRAIQEIMTSQTLHYTFPFSRFTFETDISAIVLVEGRKSTFFQTSLNVPLQSTVDSNLYRSKEEVAWPSPGKLAIFRSFIKACKATTGKVKVSEAASKYIQEDFVRQRQEDKTTTPDDLIHLMRAARLLAASYLQEEVTIEVWEKTKELEAARKSRAASLNIGT